MIRSLSLSIILSVVLLSAGHTLADDSKYLTPRKLKQQTIVVDDLGAEFHTASGNVTVTAKIKNISHSIIRGYATIYLLSSEGQEIFSYQEDVNGGEPFPHGVSVDFKASTHVGSLNKVASISVDFTQF